MSPSLCSIIVPMYNVESYILRCLKSLSAQTFSNVEIIIVDDGSTDGSVAICEQY
ncbi:glycosyltransferase family 2 protein, partial [Pseudomonas carnis]|nr:glycosyltransferase family 2 protein [Pseudomonas carnis]